jgi:hypothetical protein
MYDLRNLRYYLRICKFDQSSIHLFDLVLILKIINLTSL